MALISCKNCGNLVSDRAKTCPKCGEPIFSDEATQLNAPNQAGYSPQGGPVPPAPVGSAQPPSTPVAPTPQAAPAGRPTAQVPPPVSYGTPVAPVTRPEKRTSPALVGILSALAMAVLMLGGFALYKYVIEPKNAEPEQEVVSFEDTSPAVEDKPVSREQSQAESTEQIEVFMDLWGNIGEAVCQEFKMDGTTGYYSLQGADNVRRTMKLIRYDSKSGYCEIEAFLRNKYIGKFVGTYTVIDEPHSANIYKGEFISVKKGVSLDFYLYVD